MNTEVPLYKQIVYEIENGVLSGEFQPGDKIPSIRVLAVKYQVNPHTAQRAARELNRTGLFTSRRGTGMTVTENTDLICHFREKRADRIMRLFLKEMELLGFTHSQLKEMISTALKKHE